MIAKLLIPGIGILLVAGVLYLRQAHALRRTRQMRALARRMGWSFQARPPLDAVPDRDRLGLFAVRMHKRMRNHLSGTVGEYRVAIFDLELSTIHRDGVQAYEQTVVHVHSPRLDLPAFSLRPETLRLRAGDRMGGDDIDFDADPAFSDAHLLRGPDEAAVRGLFGARVRDVYKHHPNSSTDAEGADLLFWRRGELVRPDDVPALVQTALELAARLGRRAPVAAGA
jgi:hypothetical protein